jgi:hypothetical protein
LIDGKIASVFISVGSVFSAQTTELPVELERNEKPNVSNERNKVMHSTESGSTSKQGQTLPISIIKPLEAITSAPLAVAGVYPEAYRTPYLHAIFARGIGGTTGEMLTHSLDTVRTHQQGDPYLPRGKRM